MPKTYDPLIALRIPPEMDARLRALSDATGTSISEIVRTALDQLLGPRSPGEMRTQGAPPPRIRRAATRPERCQHRVRSGHYCGRCSEIVP